MFWSIDISIGGEDEEWWGRLKRGEKIQRWSKVESKVGFFFSLNMTANYCYTSHHWKKMDRNMYRIFERLTQLKTQVGIYFVCLFEYSTSTLFLYLRNTTSTHINKAIRQCWMLVREGCIVFREVFRKLIWCSYSWMKTKGKMYIQQPQPYIFFLWLWLKCI